MVGDSIADLFGPEPEEPAVILEPLSGREVEPEILSDEILSEDQLERQWGAPPFSMLRQSAGSWQKRKRAWVGLGIRSHLGRRPDLIKVGPAYNRTELGYQKREERARYRQGFGNLGDAGAALKAYKNGEAWQAGADEANELSDSTSVFDPVLAELAYAWFCPPGGRILDPCAGGSVRGIVAGYMGYDYLGIDLRPEQVEANEEQREEIFGRLSEVDRFGKRDPEWRVANSTGSLEDQGVPVGEVDFIFSCPPYYDLEVYSSDREDLSNASSYSQFLTEYRALVYESCRHLRQDRYAAFVVGEIRDKRSGLYRGFVGDTIEAFRQAGLGFYNHAIIAGPAASAALRANTIFGKSRKLVKAHQDLLVFVKGDGRAAADLIGPYRRVDLGDRVDQLRLDWEA